MEGFLEPKKNSKDENLKDEKYLKKKGIWKIICKMELGMYF